MRKIFFACFIALFTFSSCKKEDDGSKKEAVGFQEVRIYQTENAYNIGSEIGSRSSSTTNCENTYNTNAVAWGFSCSNFVSFLGYSADNGVQDLPTNFSVPTDVSFLSPDDTEIAVNWTDLIDDRDVALEGTGMPDVIVWNGFSNSGVLDDNCDDWSSDSNAFFGANTQVNAAVTPGSWHTGGTNCSGASTRHYLCLCW